MWLISMCISKQTWCKAQCGPNHAKQHGASLNPFKAELGFLSYCFLERTKSPLGHQQWRESTSPTRTPRRGTLATARYIVINSIFRWLDVKSKSRLKESNCYHWKQRNCVSERHQSTVLECKQANRTVRGAHKLAAILYEQEKAGEFRLLSLRTT